MKENSEENEKCEGKQWRKQKVWRKTVKKTKSVKENSEENEDRISAWVKVENSNQRCKLWGNSVNVSITVVEK